MVRNSRYLLFYSNSMRDIGKFAMNLLLDTLPHIYRASYDPAFSKLVLDNPNVDWPESLPSERSYLKERIQEYLKVCIGPLVIFPKQLLNLTRRNHYSHCPLLADPFGVN
jgi:hypothetical protein